MITYDSLYRTLEKRGKSVYQLLRDKVVGGGTLNNIRACKPINTNTINDICNYLRCKPSDVISYIPDQSKDPD